MHEFYLVERYIVVKELFTAELAVKTFFIRRTNVMHPCGRVRTAETGDAQSNGVRVC